MPATATVESDTGVARYRFDCDQFERMLEEGILHNKVELLRGEIWDSCNLHEPQILKLTIEQYDRIYELGIFEAEARVELIDGEVYELAPAGDWHNASVDRAAWSLRAIDRGDRIIRSQGSIEILPGNEPEPDVSVLRFRSDFYEDGGAAAADVLLIVEVSDTTVRHDRGLKLSRYALAGIPEVWIVTKEPRAIEVYRQPRDGEYTEQRTYRPGETLAAEALPDVRVAVSDITG